VKVIQLHYPDKYRGESKLIAKAIKKNREAQHVLFELHAPKMLSVCRYYIKDVQQAEEVLLNGFFKVFKYLNTFKAEGSFEGWIRRIMVREAISYLRGQKRLEFLVEESDFKQNAIDSINLDIAVDEIQQLIDSLPDGYKLIFNMYVIEGYKHHEIATMLDISEGTSKSQLFKARQLLQEKIINLNSSSYGAK
jgi:RNA polymerase sigma-70 factor (ECF subfamily)